jgi:pilus assembly protein CpaB
MMRRLLILAMLPLLASACSEVSAAEPSASARVAIVVALRDLPAGSTLTYDDIAQRSIPAGLVSSSVLTPDSASYVINHKLTLPLLAGDPVQWTFFESSPQQVRESCAKFEGEDTSAEQQVARARQIVLSHSR